MCSITVLLIALLQFTISCIRLGKIWVSQRQIFGKTATPCISSKILPLRASCWRIIINWKKPLPRPHPFSQPFYCGTKHGRYIRRRLCYSVPTDNRSTRCFSTLCFQVGRQFQAVHTTLCKSHPLNVIGWLRAGFLDYSRHTCSPVILFYSIDLPTRLNSRSWETRLGFSFFQA